MAGRSYKGEDQNSTSAPEVIAPQEIRVVQTGVKVWDRCAPWSKWELDQIEELANAVKRSPLPRTKELAERCIEILNTKKI